jgi:branched-chain amino acid transport system ATP-binding protein
MLAVGRALMSRPRLLLVEEPSLGLAPLIVSRLYQALRAMCARGLAVVIAEQFQRFEPKYSNRWIVLERGTIQATGSEWGEAQGGGEEGR